MLYRPHNKEIYRSSLESYCNESGTYRNHLTPLTKRHGRHFKGSGQIKLLFPVDHAGYLCGQVGRDWEGQVARVHSGLSEQQGSGRPVYAKKVGAVGNDKVHAGSRIWGASAFVT